MCCATSAPTFRFTSQPNFQKKSCSSRKRFSLVWCGRRDLNSRTIFVMVSRVVGLEAHWTFPCYVLDQARLRPHGPPRLPLGSSILPFQTRRVQTDSSEQGFRREPKTATPQPCHHILTRAGEHAVYQSFLAPSSSSLSDPGRLQPSRSLKVSLLSRPSSSSDSHLEPRLR